jgi:hypothetical protein
MDKNLAMALHSNGIAYLNADWDTAQSDGLVHLYGFQRNLMDEACSNIATAYSRT